jgi:hypothetical protein
MTAPGQKSDWDGPPIRCFGARWHEIPSPIGGGRRRPLNPGNHPCPCSRPAPRSRSSPPPAPRSPSPSPPASAITAGALVKVQVRPQGSAAWFDLLSLAFGTTAAPAPASAETRVVPLPDDAAEARLEYAVPTGSSGHTLDAEIGQITAY